MAEGEAEPEIDVELILGRAAVDGAERTGGRYTYKKCVEIGSGGACAADDS